MRWRERNLLNLALLLGIALVLLGIARIWWPGGSPSPQTSAARGPEVPTAPILRDRQPLSAFAVIAAKNLFSSDRRGPALGAAKSQNSLEGSQLLGIIIIGRTRAALIGSKTGSPPQGGAEVEVVYQGDEWSGLKLIEISNYSVIFQGKDGRRTLNFPE